MSENTIAALVALLAALSTVVVLFGAALRAWERVETRRIEARQENLSRPFDLPSFVHEQDAAEQDEPEHHDEQDAAEREHDERMAQVTIHPSKPPRLVTYNPQPGRPPMTCHCHGRELVPGEEVLLLTQQDDSVLRLHPSSLPQVGL